MTLTIDLTPEEETQLKTVASQRGVRPEEHAHTLLANLLRDVPIHTPTPRTNQEERERLTAAVKSGDKQAWIQLLYMTPPGRPIDAATGLPPESMPREALSREYIYED